MKLQIDRLALTLHGVSAETARAAVDGLDAEIRRRLSGPARGWVERDLGVVVIGPVELKRARDAAALRGLIAERLALALGGAGGEAEAEREDEG
jgi:hypothetical protein